MCEETRIPRDMCAGNTIPGETRIPMTPVQAIILNKRDKPLEIRPPRFRHSFQLRNLILYIYARINKFLNNAHRVHVLTSRS